jgi:zinc/manganese transport system substrate-binding protein/manganese/iron transport system substrate-binding protein
LEFVGSVIFSFDTQSELSAHDVAELVATIKRTGVKAVFSEHSLPPKTAAAIARQAGVKVVAGDDALYGDSLGPAGSDAATFLDMERHNTREIVDNLR